MHRLWRIVSQIRNKARNLNLRSDKTNASGKCSRLKLRNAQYKMGLFLERQTKKIGKTKRIVCSLSELTTGGIKSICLPNGYSDSACEAISAGQVFLSMLSEAIRSFELVNEPIKEDLAAHSKECRLNLK